MFSRKAASVLFAFLSFGLASSARANTITLTDVTGSSDFATNASDGGGPFMATTDSLGDFVTFCLEFSEHFSYGTPYTFTLSDGAGASASGQPTPNFDPISDATKWIYTQVRTGGYTSFRSFGSGADVGARVQEAIWYLEGERTSDQILEGSLGLAKFARLQDWSLLAADGHTVQAMNIFTASGDPVQDQLYWSQTVRTSTDAIPTPEPASLLLFGTGLLAVGRRFRKKKQ